MHLVRTSSRFALAVHAAVVALWLGGCSLRQADRNPRPTVETAATYTFPVDPRLANRPWWTVFDSPELDSLIDTVLADNFDLRQAVARVEQARALVGIESSAFGPDLDYSGSALGGWEENSHRRRNINLGFDLSWEVDLWGRLASAVSAAAQETIATQYDYDALRLLLSGEVADTYFRVLEQLQTVDLLNRQFDASQQNLDFIFVTFGQGGAPAVDVLQQKEQLASVHSQQPRPRSNLRIFRNRLSVLMGEAPSGAEIVDSTAFPEVAVDQPIGVPSELLMNRPDLRAHAARLVAIDYRIAAAIADCYPRLTLDGTVGRSSTLDPSVFFANALTNAVGPILDSGRRKSVIALRRNEFEEQLALFNQAFLEALEEVENALWEELHQRESIEALEDQRKVAEELLTESKAQYIQKPDNYLSILVALQSVQRIERELISSRRELLSIRVRLYLAAGGPIH